MSSVRRMTSGCQTKDQNSLVITIRPGQAERGAASEMCPPNPARFLLRFRGCVALSRAVAPAVADRVAEQRVQKPCKIKAVAVLRFHRGDGGCAASGNLGPPLDRNDSSPLPPAPAASETRLAPQEAGRRDAVSRLVSIVSGWRWCRCRAGDCAKRTTRCR